MFNFCVYSGNFIPLVLFPALSLARSFCDWTGAVDKLALVSLYCTEKDQVRVLLLEASVRKVE